MFTVNCNHDDSDGLEATQESLDLSNLQQDRRDFSSFLESTLEDLGQGKLTLRLSSQRIIGYALLHYASHVANVRLAEEGASLLEMVACNSLRHFRVALECENPPVGPAEVLRGLEQQLAQIIEHELRQR